MKISESRIQFVSSHSAEQADLELEKESRKTVQQHTVVPSRNQRMEIPSRAGSWINGGRSRFWVDRVSLSRQDSREMQSEYSASLASSSRVNSGQDGSTAEFENKELVEKLAGAAMDRQVIISFLEAGEDIVAGESGGSAGGSTGGIWATRSESWVSLNKTRIHFEEEQMGFSSEGQVVTEDGRTIEFNLDIALDRAYLSRTQEQTLIHTWQEEINLIDPLVINLEGGVPRLSDTRFEFDLDNDGVTEEVSFAAKGSGFLSLDRNNDGVINDGSELFGPGTGNGFGELAAYDEDGNGWIDENDAVFSQLTVWTRNEDGEDQLVSLKDAGVGAIYLDNAQTEFKATDMNNELQGEVRRSGVFLFENGNVGAVQQIDLAARAPGGQEVEFKSVEEFSAMPELPEINLGEGGGVAPQLNPVEIENPMSVLMDQINALRSELREFLDSKKSELKQPSRLTSMTAKISDYSLYRLTHPDAAGFNQRSYQP